MQETVTTAKWNTPNIEKVVETLNKKARKLGTAPITLTYSNEHVVRYDRHPLTNQSLTSPMFVEYVDATIDYEIPVIDGWAFQAKFDIYPSETENVVIVSAMPDVVIPAEFQNKNEIHCDHCGYNRNRYHSVLLRHVETGEYKEVGSTCVKDFIGHDPKVFLFYASISFKELCGGFNGESGFGRRLYSYGLMEVLTYTSAVIKKFGWRSKGVAYEQGGESTSGRVWDNLEPTPDFIKYHKDELVVITDEDKKIAEDTIEYFKNAEGDNDYMATCKKLVTLNYVPSKHMGFATSMVNGYNRYLEKKVYEKTQTATIPASGWVGEIKDRITKKVKCLFAKEIETMYGLSTLYIMVDEDGNIYKTFYSGRSMNMEKDGIYMMTGTVKKHGEYNGKKETFLNRVSAIEANEADAIFTFKSTELIKADEFAV